MDTCDREPGERLGLIDFHQLLCKSVVRNNQQHHDEISLTQGLNIERKLLLISDQVVYLTTKSCCREVMIGVRENTSDVDFVRHNEKTTR